MRPGVPDCLALVAAADGPVLAGIVLGTLFSVGLTLAGIARVSGVHVGVIGCVLNTVVAVGGSILMGEESPSLAAGRQPRGESSPA